MRVISTSRILLACSLLLIVAGPVPAGEAERAATMRDNATTSQTTCSIAPPRVVERSDYYEISGTCENDLRSQMQRNGPAWSDGKHYDSLTRWRLTWDYGYNQAPGACSPDGFRVNVNVLFQYPAWTGTEGAHPVLVEKWNQYLKNLSAHEQGHRDLAVRAAEDITRSVAVLPAAPRCCDLDRQVKELCRMRLEKLDQEEMAYDTATNHGAVQGALFP